MYVCMYVCMYVYIYIYIYVYIYIYIYIYIFQMRFDAAVRERRVCRHTAERSLLTDTTFTILYTILYHIILSYISCIIKVVELCRVSLGRGMSALMGPLQK